jgi:hypothetical protein
MCDAVTWQAYSVIAGPWCPVCRGVDAWPYAADGTPAPDTHQCRAGYESRLCGVCSEGRAGQISLIYLYNIHRAPRRFTW